MMLHELKRGDRFRIINKEYADVPPVHRALTSDEVLTLERIDGMYSICTDQYGRSVHPSVISEVEKD